MKFDKDSPRIRELKLTLYVIRKSKMAMVSICVLLFFFTIAILAPVLSPYDPTEVHPAEIFMPPSSKYPLGTDYLGRDNLSRILYGARYSMFASLLVVVLTVLIGMPIGAVSGYLGGKVDETLMRITDIILSFPGITLALLLAYVMGRGIFSAALALSLTGWTSMARIVRGVVLSEKGKDYVIAARLIGKNDFQILFGEIMPNCMYPVIIQAVMMMGTVIISLAGLSFIGVGVQPPEPDWGVIIAEGRQYLLEYPWLSILPGILMITVVLSYNLVGDRLRDALDPRLRGELAAK
ncbi:MAG: ABC transporter permease [Nitrososphaeria archaeon]|nr:ABC transporter permease [Nitrososphaeria archaeon]